VTEYISIAIFAT